MHAVLDSTDIVLSTHAVLLLVPVSSPAAAMSYYTNNSSPPPLQHPVPTHPAYIPEPPSTPMSPQGYQRYASSPPAAGYAQPVPTAGPASHLSPPYAATAGAYQPPHQPHPQNAAPPVDFSAWGLDNATAAFGMQLGHNAVAAGQEYVQKNVRARPPSRSLSPARRSRPARSSAAGSRHPCSSTTSTSPTRT